MADPNTNIGMICKSMEKYYDPSERKMKVKSRPMLIVGCEPDYTSIMDVDYELLPISTMKNKRPTENYDHLLDGELYSRLGLNEISYIRTHKTTWNHVKNMVINSPIGNLKEEDPELFNAILEMNEKWVLSRNEGSTVDTIEYIDDAV